MLLRTYMICWTPPQPDKPLCVFFQDFFNFVVFFSFDSDSSDVYFSALSSLPSIDLDETETETETDDE